MTLHPKNHWDVPKQTAQVAYASFPKGNVYMKMHDELGSMYTDEDFQDLFPARCGQSAISPASLALITVMQFSEGLTDIQAAEAVRGRIDWDKQVAQCPQGHFSSLWRSSSDCNKNPLIEIVFDKKLCNKCRVRSNCTSAKTAPRKLKLRPRQEYQALIERRQKQQTKEFEQDYSRRAGIEGTISQAVGRFDLRRTRYYGLAKTHLQHVATACAINLSRFFAWSKHIPKARTRTSSFSMLNVSAF